jgi:hypothetical protein
MAPTDKQIKAAAKEGAKKGVDLEGMSAMGGVKFFHVAVDSAADSMELLDHVLGGFNIEVDEAAEERKGGAGDLAKIILSASDNVLNMLCHVPANLTVAIDQKEWFNAAVAAAKGTLVESGDPTVLKATTRADANLGLFPLKLRDEAINAGYNYLVTKELVLPDESDDDANYAEVRCTPVFLLTRRMGTLDLLTASETP